MWSTTRGARPGAARSSGPVDALRDLGALALPVDCAVCGCPDDPLCARCAADLAACRWPTGPRQVRPRPCPPGLPTVHSAGRYAEALAAVVSAYKDDGRRQHAGVLGALLAESVDAAVGASPELLAVLAGANGPVLVVPVPSSAAARRRRGDAPLVAVARVAVGGYAAAELVVAEALAPRRRVADQAGLAARERAVNLEHSMTVTTRWEPVVRGAACVVVDDVLTTGATLVEAARALGAAGARVVVAATVCATQRRADAARHPRSGQPPPASGAVPAGRAARSGPAQQTRGKR